MARSQSDLQAILAGLDGVNAAYIQPPTKLDYPCIMIERGLPSSVSFADNIKYLLKKGYTITVMDRNPESLIPDLVEELPHCQVNQAFKTEGINHTVFQLFF